MTVLSHFDTLKWIKPPDLLAPGNALAYQRNLSLSGFETLIMIMYSVALPNDLGRMNVVLEREKAVLNRINYRHLKYTY